MPSFDVVSEVDMHEVTNAIDQANKEVTTRFDFKGVDAGYKGTAESVELHAESAFQLDQMRDVFWGKLGKRQVPLASFDVQNYTGAGKLVHQSLTIKQGIETQIGKDIVKSLKGSKMKVQASIQGDQLRVTGKKRDDLQAAIAFLKENDYGQPLQFKNFRD